MQPRIVESLDVEPRKEKTKKMRKRRIQHLTVYSITARWRTTIT